jgi:hypothetical protein
MAATTAAGGASGFTVMVADAAWLATAALIMATPAVNAVTTPFEDTVATDGFCDE